MNEKNARTKFTTRSRSPSGFTLIELMIALTLSLFLIGAIVLVYLSGRSATMDAAQLSRMQENIRFASDYLIRDLRNAGFYDETALLLGSVENIRESYMELVDESTVRVRYAGRGHCAERFDDLRVVENQYSFENGRLVCRGRSVENDEVAGEIVSIGIETAPWDPQLNEPGLALVSGITSLGFEAICAGGGSGCLTASRCDVSAAGSLSTSCIGVRLRLGFEGLAVGGDVDSRILELNVAFRNIALARFNLPSL